ncbi:flavodoxin domain-containing protein, partial [Escherichia coli]
MNKVLLAYASMSGNTEAIADVIEEVLVEEKLTVNRLEVFDLTPEDIRDFDYIILGSYTWGDGELPDEFLDFYDE